MKSIKKHERITIKKSDSSKFNSKYYDLLPAIQKFKKDIKISFFVNNKLKNIDSVKLSKIDHKNYELIISIHKKNSKKHIDLVTINLSDYLTDKEKELLSSFKEKNDTIGVKSLRVKIIDETSLEITERTGTAVTSNEEDDSDKKK